jgi:hypothetical protein
VIPERWTCENCGCENVSVRVTRYGRVFAIEWDSDLGQDWLDADNVARCLKGEHKVAKDINILVLDVTEAHNAKAEIPEA